MNKTVITVILALGLLWVSFSRVMERPLGRPQAQAPAATVIVTVYVTPAPVTITPTTTSPPEVPEPGSLILIVGGLGVLVGYTRLKRAQNNKTP